MSTKALSIVISKKDLDYVVGRAAIAAMTEEGQSEISRASNETKGCVRISAFNNKIIFESSVSRFSSRYIVEVDNKGGASIVSEGETCVPAKELKTVSGKIRNDRNVSISFVPVPVDSSSGTATARAVLPDGVVEIGSISGNKVVSKTKIEAYPASHFSAPQYPETSLMKIIADGKASGFKKACNTIAFSVNPSDLKEVFDKFAIFTASDGIYFVGSDGRRCSVVKASADMFNSFSNVDMEVPLLADAEFASPALSSIADDDPLLVGVDQDGERMYLCSGNTSYCINMLNESSRKQYPNYKRITDLPTKVVVLINRDEFSETMDLLGVVNNDRGIYTFCKDEHVVKLVGRGIGTVKETTGSVGYTVVSSDDLKSQSISLNTKYLTEGIKKMSCENIRMSFTEAENRVKIEDEKDSKFIYFMQVMNPNEA
jgi:DNA polymerase III sliding clamp (beta) subunit (PCNA family)